VAVRTLRAGVAIGVVFGGWCEDSDCLCGLLGLLGLDGLVGRAWRSFCDCFKFPHYERWKSFVLCSRRCEPRRKRLSRGADEGRMARNPNRARPLESYLKVCNS